MRRKLFAILFMLLPLLLTVSAVAQFSQRGSIGGVVTDASGAVVPQASVTLLDVQRNQTTKQTTNAAGRYEFSQLLPGTYTVSIEAAGFNKTVSDPLEVNTQAVVRYDGRLQAGAVTQQVEVSTAAPLLQTESVGLDQNISEEQVETLPMNGRNWTSLTELTPGVSTSPRNNINLSGTFEVGASYTSGGADFTAGGNAEGSRDNGYYVNGVNANENYESGSSFQPSAESISDVKINVADFSAQYGRDFTNVNVTTKSGTNSFHGEAYEYFENDALNALVPINKAQGLLTKSAYRFNMFGGGVGGPIYIPKILPLKDRAFFFVNYERNPHSLTGPNNLAIVPSDAQRAGNYGENCTGPINAGSFNGSGICSNPAGQLYNPYTGTAVPNNDLVAAGLYNPATAPPQVAGIINLFPQANLTPTAANSGANYQYSSSQAVNPYHWDSRFDVRITSRDSAFVAWSQYSGIPNNAGGLVPNLMQENADVSDKSHVVTIDEAHTFSARVTNEFIFAFGSGSLETMSASELAYANSSANPFNQIFQNTGTSAGGNTGVLALNIYNYGPLFNQPSVGFNEYFQAANSSRQFSDNLQWVHGSHNMSFGFNYLRKIERDFDSVRYVAFGCAPAPGAYCGNGPQIFTGSNGVGGDAFADTMLGLPSVIHQRYGYTTGGPFAPDPNVIIPYYGAYFTDTWKVMPTVTVTYGIRYDLPIPTYASNNICCALYQAASDTLAIPGLAPGVPQHYASAPKDDFAPRFSVAWEARPSLVIRAGYGLFYNTGASQISNLLNGALYGGVPGGFIGPETDFSTPVPGSITQAFQASPILPPGTFPVSTGPGQGYNQAGSFQTIFYADTQSFHTPYISRYMLDVQKEINRNTVITATYLGAGGRNGWYNYDENVPSYRTGWSSIDAFNAARPNNAGRFGDIYVQRAGLNSNYNAGIIKFQHRMSHGLEILSHYTFAKTLGDRGIVGQLSQDAAYNYPLSVIPSYGQETYSHRHRFLFQALYQPTYAQSLPRYLRPALGDWHLSLIGTFESGDQLTASNGAGNQANDFAPFNGLGNLNMLHNPNFAHSKRSFNEYFDTSALVVPPNNQQGTAAPGIIQGPGQNNWDVSIGKIFPIYESLHVEFRTDMYNALNHTQWNAISTQVNGSTGPFGQITGSREGRIIQFAGKVVF